MKINKKLISLLLEIAKAVVTLILGFLGGSASASTGLWTWHVSQLFG